VTLARKKKQPSRPDMWGSEVKHRLDFEAFDLVTPACCGKGLMIMLPLSINRNLPRVLRLGFGQSTANFNLMLIAGNNLIF